MTGADASLLWAEEGRGSITGSNAFKINDEEGLPGFSSQRAVDFGVLEVLPIRTNSPALHVPIIVCLLDYMAEYGMLTDLAAYSGWRLWASVQIPAAG